MTGQTIDINKYKHILKNMQGPISADRIPNARIDFRALIKYAASKGVQPGELSDEEKNRFFIDGHDMAWIKANADYWDAAISSQ